jgi:uncharacterized membrane protein YccC
MNFGLGVIFLTPFVLVLVNIPSPGHPLLAESRIIDTLIAAGLALVTMSVLWASSRWKHRRVETS